MSFAPDEVDITAKRARYAAKDTANNFVTLDNSTISVERSFLELEFALGFLEGFRFSCQLPIYTPSVSKGELLAICL